MAILASGKTRSLREPDLGCRGADRLGDVMFCQKGLHENCRMGRRIDADTLIFSLGDCECEGDTVHKLIQQHLTAD
jgi:hypothetical protein